MIRFMLPRNPLFRPARTISAFPLMAVLAACSPVGMAVGAAATTINLATQERGLIVAVDDNVIWLEINRRLLARDEILFRDVRIQVHEGRVLLAGILEKPEDRVEATAIAWQVGGVREVINEMQVGSTLGVDDYAEDLWLAQRLRLKLLADRRIRANNYSVDCIRGAIYLIGIARDEAELQRAIDHARDLAYVRKVISRVRLSTDPMPPLPPSDNLAVPVSPPPLAPPAAPTTNQESEQASDQASDQGNGAIAVTPLP
jgi:osmotically-inducible protein OsmY